MTNVQTVPNTSKEFGWLGWPVVLGYTVGYEIIRLRQKKSLLSHDAYLLDEHPALRVAVAASALVLLNHLFGFRRPW